ncbi:hypothetical protein Sa4125_33050 [Aureimonas sp. SA4125]|uniref:hypothetical protein n=1 Tax=Aureimonas sp. SA4125 TaxID=2826993 RepID=UPI001CC5FC28|nr:hypothetical protein [Aureimonas sp. SA4125]BDA85763.1 hypothetical protein Sa4125_33050 [Aureimonas sp. SA4125]
MHTRFPVALAAVLMVTGCTTTEEANVAMRTDWIGRSSDDFFSAYGPPYQSYDRQDGGTIYSWRGGETRRFVPAQFATVGEGRERKTTRVVTDSSGRSVVETRSRTEEPLRVMTAPPRSEELFCEAQITADKDGIIRFIGATGDTDGEGLSFSRCGELFKPDA